MVLNGFRMLHMGGTLVRDWPNLLNTKFTTGHNVVEESMLVVRFTNVVAVPLLVVALVVALVVSAVAEAVTSLTCWRARRRSVQLN